MSGNLEKQLVGTANDLITQLEAGDNESAMKTIEKLYQSRDFGLYNEIGKLTRTVHNAISNFHVSTDPINVDGVIDNPQGDDASESRMVDAKDRLEYVITLTENAANKTMDMVEDTVPIAKEVGDTAKKLKADWERLMRKEMNPDEFRNLYKEIDGFLTFAGGKADSIESNLSSILLAQDYQDLTGQVIKKVIKLVREVQDSLVELVSVASKVESITGLTHLQEEPEKKETEDAEHARLEGPVINAEGRSDVVTSQDDVDDLLSSLGF